MKNSLRVFMAIKNISISDIHEDTGISRTTISDIYHERTKNPQLQTIMKIADYLDVTLDELLTKEIIPMG